MSTAVKQRLEAVDSLRGLTIFSMILYHGMWDLVVLFGLKARWYLGLPGFLWQQSICWTFIFLAGFSWQLSRSHSRRGLLTLAGGALVSLVTMAVMPGHGVRFGVLTLLGSCMLLWIPLDRLLRRCPPGWGLTGAGALFAAALPMTRYSGKSAVWVPEALDPALAYLGFPQPGFSSADYFPLLPWIFLFGAGYFSFSLLKNRGLLRKWLEKGRIPLVSTLGRNSLTVYLLHQPILYGLCFLGIWLTGR